MSTINYVFDSERKEAAREVFEVELREQDKGVGPLRRNRHGRLDDEAVTM